MEQLSMNLDIKETPAPVKTYTRRRKKNIAKEQLVMNFESNMDRDNLIINNQNLVWGVIRDMKAKGQFLNYSVTFDEEDLFQTGLIGLVRAADNYRSDKGALFSTFAVWCIRNNIINELKRNSVVKGKVFKSYDSHNTVMDDTTPIRAGESVEESIDFKRLELRDLIDKMILRNPKKKRAILDGAKYLFEVSSGRKTPEIAEMYGVEVKKIKNSIKQFKRLAEKIEA